MSEVSVDPLLVPGSSVWVEEVATGYKVSIRNPDRESAADVMQRAQAMLSPASRALAKASPTN
jgi:hypothetical protein